MDRWRKGKISNQLVSLSRSFYQRRTEVVAFELIGKILIIQEQGTNLKGRIVETEAYLGSQDLASHACRGVTPRNRVMFGPPGISYVYFTYGNHHCLNVVTEDDQVPGAVLIRALEPIAGIDLMTKRRGGVKLEALTSGPGKLTQAFGITREHSGINLTEGLFFIADDENQNTIHIRATTRIGISQAKDLPYRYYEVGNKFVSVI